MSVAGQSETRTFSIRNTGTASLNLLGTPRVAISGADASDFVLVSAPDAEVQIAQSSLFEVRFTPSSSGLKRATIRISTDDLDEATYNFAVQGTGGLDNDEDGVPDSLDDDDDNDGVTDVDELNEGTESFDYGSYVERFNGSYCVEWNGFSDFLTQIFELRNKSESEIEVAVRLFTIDGALGGAAGFSLTPGIQRDIIVNDFSGFTSQQYGEICAYVVSGPVEGLSAQMLAYALTADSYRMAFTSGAQAGRSGAQFVSFNTYQPSLNPLDGENFVANWMQVNNADMDSQSGTIRIYNLEGIELGSTELHLAAGERRDISIHAVGQAKAGLVAWEPDSAEAHFKVSKNRYYYGHSGLGELHAAISLPALRGNGETLIASFDSTESLAVFELSNTTTEEIEVQVLVRDQNGALSDEQPSTITIPAYGTRNIVLNQYFSGLGSVLLDANQRASLIASMFHYGLNANGGIQYVAKQTFREPLSMKVQGSYNSYLEQQCSIRVVNQHPTPQVARLSMTRYDGTQVIDRERLSVPAFGTSEVQLCSLESAAAYGSVTLEYNDPEALLAEIRRASASGSVEFSSEMKP